MELLFLMPLHGNDNLILTKMVSVLDYSSFLYNRTTHEYVPLGMTTIE